jgi:hypothetical protein
VELLKSEYAKLAETWDVEAVYAQAIPDVGFKTFLEGMVVHVI